MLETKKPQPSQVLDAKLEVQGMTCASCSGAISKHLESLEAVISAKVSLLTNTAIVRFDGALTHAEELCEEIMDLGFDAHVVRVQDTAERETVSRKAASRAQSVAEALANRELRRFIVELTCVFPKSDDERKEALCINTEAVARLPGVLALQVVHDKRELRVVLNRRELVPAAVLDVLSRDSGLRAASHSLRQLAADVGDREEDSKTSQRNGDEERAKVVFVLGALGTHAPADLELAVTQRWPRFVTSAKCDLLTKRLVVEYYAKGGDACCEDVTLRDVHLFLTQTLGLSAEPLDSAEAERDAFRAAQQREVQTLQRKFFLAVILAVPAFVISMVIPMAAPRVKHKLMRRAIPGTGVTVMGLLLFTLCSPVQFYVARGFYHSAWSALKHRSSNMATLIVIGTTTAWLYGFASLLVALLAPHATESLEGGEHFFETASTVICIVLLGKWMQARAKWKTCDAISLLMDLQESHALLVRFKKDGSIDGEDLIPSALISVGDVFKVKRGERVPLDGTVVFGSTSMDESSLTGESIPRAVRIGESVMASAINCGDNVVMVRCDRLSSDSMLSHVIELIRASQLSKPSQQEIADRISSYFVPCVATIALLTFATWVTLCSVGVVSRSMRHGDHPLFFSLLFAMSVLVIACPCALGLATPTAVMVGIGIGSKHGLLIKGGSLLEIAHKVNAVIFDKTGTLTLGIPKVLEFIVNQEDGKEEDEKNLLVLAASAELNSEHPLAKAIVDFAKRRVFSIADLCTPQTFVTSPGQGIHAVVNGQDIHIGNELWFVQQLKIAVNDQMSLHMHEKSRSGHIPLLLSVDQRVRGVFVIFDPPRSESSKVLSELSRRGIQTKMLTGDASKTALAVAEYLGMRESDVISQVLPHEKHRVVQKLQQGKSGAEKEKEQEEGLVVAMVGDGVNDAAALSQADLGIAIGNGTDIAIEAADVILMNDDLQNIVTLLDLSRVVIRRIYWNFFWAFGFNVLGIPLAAGVLYPSLQVRLPPAFAALAMACSSLCVLASSLALKWYTPPLRGCGENDHKSQVCSCGINCKCSMAKKKRSAECLCANCECYQRLDSEVGTEIEINELPNTPSSHSNQREHSDSGGSLSSAVSKPLV